MTFTRSAAALGVAVALAGTAAGIAGCGPIMAASAMYPIPVIIFFLIVRRRLVGGLTAGAVKG